MSLAWKAAGYERPCVGRSVARLSRLWSTRLRSTGTWSTPAAPSIAQVNALRDRPRLRVTAPDLAAGWQEVMAVDQPTAESMLRELDRFVGDWTMTAVPPGGPPWPGEARVRFEWLDGGAFLVERWSLDLPEVPDGTPRSGTSIIGCDAAKGTYVQLYADERGVRRVYEMGLRAGEWTLRREGAPFAQRFTGTFSADGTTIAGRWELAPHGEDWTTDFDVTYTRVTSAARV